jgi:hypothetical protein
MTRMHKGEMKVKPHMFLTSALKSGEWSDISVSCQFISQNKY